MILGFFHSKTFSEVDLLVSLDDRLWRREGPKGRNELDPLNL